MSATGRFRATDYVLHMLEAIHLARGYVEGFDKVAFLGDRRTQQAVVMNPVILGEAATRLADRHPGFVLQHPEIPWNSMRGMRNRLAHGYFDINLDVVWDTLLHDLPAVATTLRLLIPAPVASRGTTPLRRDEAHKR